LLSFIVAILFHTLVNDLRLTPSCSGLYSFDYLVLIFYVHRVLSPKTILTMPPRRTSQLLYLDEGLPQTSVQNQPPLHHLATQTLPTITEGLEHLAFSDISEVQLYQPTSMSTTTLGTSQNGEDVSQKVVKSSNSSETDFS
jgi:hypothetical protein